MIRSQSHAKIGACAMTTKFLDNKILTFKILSSWRFPRKIAFWTIFLSAPLPTPEKRKFYFYCRLAFSDKRPSSDTFHIARYSFVLVFLGYRTSSLLVTFLLITFLWLFRGPHLFGKTVFGPFSWLFRGFFRGPRFGRIYTYSP